MGNLEVIFGIVVVVLAAVAVLGALVYAITWEVCAIKRTLAAHRRQLQPPRSYWQEHTAVSVPQRRP
jgi:hypothetical protein